MFRRTSVRSATRTRSTCSACRLSGWAPGSLRAVAPGVQRALRGHPRARALGPGGAASGADESWSGDRSAGRRLRCRSSPTRCERGSSCEWRCSTTWSCSDLSATAGKGRTPGRTGRFPRRSPEPGGGVILAGRNGHPDSLTLEGRVVSPTQGIDESLRITVTDGVISAIEPGGVRATVIAPAFVDPHVHLRTPGREDEETLRSGTEAAAGGFCAILAMPNTDPVVDSAAVLGALVERAREESVVPTGFMAAISTGQRGEKLTEMAELAATGAVAFTDDGRPVESAGLMRRAPSTARSPSDPSRSIARSSRSRVEATRTKGRGVGRVGPVGTRRPRRASWWSATSRSPLRRAHPPDAPVRSRVGGCSRRRLGCRFRGVGRGDTAPSRPHRRRSALARSQHEDEPSTAIRA